MSNVINIGGRRPHQFMKTPAVENMEQAASLAGNRWQLKQVIERMKLLHGDEAAKRAIMDVVGDIWPEA